MYPSIHSFDCNQPVYLPPLLADGSGVSRALFLLNYERIVAECCGYFTLHISDWHLALIFVRSAARSTGSSLQTLTRSVWNSTILLCSGRKHQLLCTTLPRNASIHPSIFCRCIFFHWIVHDERIVSIELGKDSLGLLQLWGSAAQECCEHLRLALGSDLQTSKPLLH